MSDGGIKHKAMRKAWGHGHFSCTPQSTIDRRPSSVLVHLVLQFLVLFSELIDCFLQVVHPATPEIAEKSIKIDLQIRRTSVTATVDDCEFVSAQEGGYTILSFEEKCDNFAVAQREKKPNAGVLFIFPYSNECFPGRTCTFGRFRLPGLGFSRILFRVDNTAWYEFGHPLSNEFSQALATYVRSMRHTIERGQGFTCLLFGCARRG